LERVAQDARAQAFEPPAVVVVDGIVWLRICLTGAAIAAARR